VNILGISCYYHDSAAAIIRDGRLVAAAQEERFTRRKHDAGFPSHAIEYCLREAGINAGQLDYVGFYDKPLEKFDRILQTSLAVWPVGYPSFIMSMPVWIKEKMWVPYMIKKALDYTGPILFSEHHVSHAASAFLVSPFKEAAILTMDGVGEWETTTYGVGRDNSITLLESIHFPHSLGLLYSAFTYYLGFRVNSAEYKVMGLAPYGSPVYRDLIFEHLIDMKEDGSFRLNMDYFVYDRKLTMTGHRFEQLFGQPRRAPESQLSQFHKDIAASLQSVTDEVVLRLASHVRRQTGMEYLCMAGGVALNCVSNSKIRSQLAFKDIFIQPAAGDAGGAVGVAFYIQNTVLGNKREYVWNNAFLGPSFIPDEIGRFLDDRGIEYERLDRSELVRRVSGLLAGQKVIGWFQGRMEFGPRALGSRSIIADARNPENWQRVNLKIKYRESFRPFAPVVLEDRMSDYFECDRPSPYMLFTAQVRPEKRSSIPAVTHVDGSARLQTLRREDHELFYDLIAQFDRDTGCPVIINTSFNVRGEPIVCTPEDAFRCFMATEMDYLALDCFLIDKQRMKRSNQEAQLSGILQLD
jgi:carbamoyltransferase